MKNTGISFKNVIQSGSFKMGLIRLIPISVFKLVDERWNR